MAEDSARLKADDPPTLNDAAQRRKQMLAKVIELHGIDSSYVASYAMVQCAYLLAELSARHDSVYEQVAKLAFRMEWLEKNLAHLAEKPATTPRGK